MSRYSNHCDIPVRSSFWQRLKGNRPSFIVALCVLPWLGLTGRIARRLPLQPQFTGDSQDYLTLASHRPPLYGWFVAVYHSLSGSLHHLPAFQFWLMAAGLLYFAIEFGLLLDAVLVGPAAILLILLHPAIHDAPREIMTESVFLALTLAGLGALFRAVRCASVPSLLVAAILLALAAATRTTGTVFLFLTPLVVLFDHRLPWRKAFSRSALAVACMVCVLLFAMTGNWMRHDRFEIGSFAGIGFLGKGLMLIEPSDISRLPHDAIPAAIATLASAEQGRRLVAEAPDLGASLRAHVQLSEDLRFAIFMPVAMRTWPAYRTADWRGRSVLAMTVAWPLIMDHPVGYAGATLKDWEELVLYPNYWPAWATAASAPRDAFPACRLQGNCYSLDRYDQQPQVLLCLAIVSIGGAVGSLLLVLTCAASVLRRCADPRTALFFWLAVMLHLSLLLSAAAEAGFPRYTVAVHVIEVAILLWFVCLTFRRREPKAVDAILTVQTPIRSSRRLPSSRRWRERLMHVRLPVECSSDLVNSGYAAP